MTIDLLTSAEQDEIVDAVRAVLAAGPTLRGDREQWRACAALGWFGLGLPEAVGGVGYGQVEEVLLHRELGRHLTTGPVLATVLGAHVAAQSADSALASRILAGECVVAWAVRSGGGRALLFDADDAELVVFVTGEGASLHEITQATDRRVVACLDETISLVDGRIDLADSAARVSLAGPETRLRALVLGAAALTGMAERGRDMSSEYAKTRHQFGQPIGVNQAIKHPCADMATRCEGALAQVLVAALRVESAHASARFDALSAFAFAHDTAQFCARATIQIHGGMGFTTGMVAHLLAKRTHVMDRMYGGVGVLLSELAKVPGGLGE
jgi:alkylation response protein AidB-like acyl-CoA dehydrogenase